jgi:diguanylate cyclase (GGDEF)-like protein
MIRKKRIQSLLVSLLTLVCLAGFAMGAVAAGETAIHVLYINSYHSGYSWSDGIEASIRKRLGETGRSFDLSVEYLDSRRFPDPALQEKLAVVLAAVGDFLYRRRDGSTFWCTISGRAFDPADFSRGILFVVMDIDERKRMEQDLQNVNSRLATLATTDPLTGLANRRQLMAAMDREISRFDRYGHPFSVILMDVDFFTSLNDSFGHDAGDSVLCQIAKILREHSRKSDMAGRWGGEEFLMVCPETDLEGAAYLAELFRSRIAHHDFNLPVLVTASFGVEQYRSGSGADALVKGADAALYQAKKECRNCVRRADAMDAV